MGREFVPPQTPPRNCRRGFYWAQAKPLPHGRGFRPNWTMVSIEMKRLADSFTAILEAELNAPIAEGRLL